MFLSAWLESGSTVQIFYVRIIDALLNCLVLNSLMLQTYLYVVVENGQCHNTQLESSDSEDYETSIASSEINNSSEASQDEHEPELETTLPQLSRFAFSGIWAVQPHLPTILPHITSSEIKGEWTGCTARYVQAQHNDEWGHKSRSYYALFDRHHLLKIVLQWTFPPDVIRFCVKQILRHQKLFMKCVLFNWWFNHHWMSVQQNNFCSLYNVYEYE